MNQFYQQGVLSLPESLRRTQQKQSFSLLPTVSLGLACFPPAEVCLPVLFIIFAELKLVVKKRKKHG